MLLIAVIAVAFVVPEIVALFAATAVPSGLTVYLLNRLFGPIKQRHLEVLWLGLGVLILVALLVVLELTVPPEPSVLLTPVWVRARFAPQHALGSAMLRLVTRGN